MSINAPFPMSPFTMTFYYKESTVFTNVVILWHKIGNFFVAKIPILP